MLNNNAHDSVGGQNTFANKVNFEKLSKSLGFKKFYLIKNKKDIKISLKKFLLTKDLSFLEVKITGSKTKKLPRPKNLITIRDKFMI